MVKEIITSFESARLRELYAELKDIFADRGGQIRYDFKIKNKHVYDISADIQLTPCLSHESLILSLERLIICLVELRLQEKLSVGKSVTVQLKTNDISLNWLNDL